MRSTSGMRYHRNVVRNVVPLYFFSCRQRKTETTKSNMSRNGSLHGGKAIPASRKKRITRGIKSLIELLKDGNKEDAPRAKQILDSCSSFIDPSNPSLQLTPCGPGSGSECPLPKYFDGASWGEVYAYAPEKDTEGKPTGNNTVVQCAPVGTVTRTDAKKQNIMDRINSILQNAYSKGVISKIEKMTDILGAVDACTTFRTRDNCEQPTIDSNGTPKCFFKEDSSATGGQCEDSTAYAIQKELGFRDRQSALVRELATIAQALTSPKYAPFRILGAGAPVPADPRMRIPYYTFQELLQRQTRKQAELDRLVAESNTVNVAMQKARREYNVAKGQEMLCAPHTKPNATYGECMGSGVCMIIKPGTGDGAGYILNGPNLAKDEKMGDAKCMPISGKNRTFFYDENTGKIWHISSKGERTEVSDSGLSKVWGKTKQALGNLLGVFAASAGNGLDSALANVENESTRLLMLMNYADETYEAIKAMFEKNDCSSVWDGGNKNFNELNKDTAAKLKTGYGDGYFSEGPTKKNSNGVDEVNPACNQVKMYNKARETFNNIQANIVELKATIQQKAPAESIRVLQATIGSQFSDDVKAMIQKGSEPNMKLSMLRQIAILQASSDFTAGEMILYDATVNDPKQTDKTWRPPAEKLFVQFKISDATNGTADIDYNGNTYTVGLHLCGKFYQDVETQQTAPTPSSKTTFQVRDDITRNILNGSEPVGGKTYAPAVTIKSYTGRRSGRTVKNEVMVDRKLFDAVNAFGIINQSALDGKKLDEIQTDLKTEIERVKKARLDGSSTGYFGGYFSSFPSFNFWRSREEMMDDEISFLSTDESVVSLGGGGSDVESVGDISLMSTEGARTDYGDMSLMSTEGARTDYGDLSLMSTEGGRTDADLSLMSTEGGRTADLSLMSTQGSDTVSLNVDRLYEEFYKDMSDTHSMASSVSNLY